MAPLTIWWINSDQLNSDQLNFDQLNFDQTAATSSAYDGEMKQKKIERLLKATEVRGAQMPESWACVDCGIPFKWLPGTERLLARRRHAKLR